MDTTKEEKETKHFFFFREMISYVSLCGTCTRPDPLLASDTERVNNPLLFGPSRSRRRRRRGKEEEEEEEEDGQEENPRGHRRRRLFLAVAAAAAAATAGESKTY